MNKIRYTPESNMIEPYKTYVRERARAIARVFERMMPDQAIQVCPRAILDHERAFRPEEEAIVYGAVVRNAAQGYKNILYTDSRMRQGDKRHGIATSHLIEAAAYAHMQLRAGNRVRIKDPRESDGKGQITVDDVRNLQDVFSELSRASGGVVLMPHVAAIGERVSIGRLSLQCHGTFDYIGNELTTKLGGEMVYGGTSLALFRNGDHVGQEKARAYIGASPEIVDMGFEAIDGYTRLAVEVGRVSFDGIVGHTDNGSTLRDIIDITPRAGGVSPAEVLAAEAIPEKPGAMIAAQCTLHYDVSTAPHSGIDFVNTDTLVINGQILEVRA